jgi:hypothetical protein
MATSTTQQAWEFTDIAATLYAWKSERALQATDGDVLQGQGNSMLLQETKGGGMALQSLNGTNGAHESPRIRKSDRKSPNGIATNDLVFSAHKGTNDEVFPQLLKLYIKPGSTVADVTYGKGVFWKGVDTKKFKLLATDLKDGIDCRMLPYKGSTIDCVVFDPPYMHTPGGTAHVNHQNYEAYYSNNIALSRSKYHEAVLDLYFRRVSAPSRCGHTKNCWTGCMAIIVFEVS